MQVNTTSSLNSQRKELEEIQEWMVSHVAELLSVSTDEINIATPFDSFGLDSSAAIGMTGALEEWLGCKISPTVVYNYPNIQDLAQHLSELPEKQ